jgi:hypothetical protein
MKSTRKKILIGVSYNINNEVFPLFHALVKKKRTTTNEHGFYTCHGKMYSIKYNFR